MTGLLNFLGKAIIPGRTFTRRMYVKISTKLEALKQYHHVNLDCEFRSDCKAWLDFLQEDGLYKTHCSRPFLDLNSFTEAEELDFHTDAAKNPKLGCGGKFGKMWYYLKWDEEFINRCNPSIEYLELYTVCMGIFIWVDHLQISRLEFRHFLRLTKGTYNKAPMPLHPDL